MNASDRIRLTHMLDAAREALAFVQDRGREDVLVDRMLALSLTKEIEIIGEAATKVSEELKLAHPMIPWAEIVGMRNRLIHAYFDINLEILWNTVSTALRPLADQLESILSKAE